ncbi:hypothetical protein V496_10539 [Pseudogymnoascus sp. VKM F-4515 (FW-2607)]|nr:hypothetical protein V496_10539 [Pseudogymnoascus sp. VKM F-4515 (FW-2607)]
MQLFQPLFVLLSLLGFSSACLILDGYMDSGRKNFRGTLVDNGRKVCEWKWGPLHNPSNTFATCLPGFAAYVTPGAKITGYSNNGKEFRFENTVSSIPAYPGLPINYTVDAKNYDC